MLPSKSSAVGKLTFVNLRNLIKLNRFDHSQVACVAGVQRKLQENYRKFSTLNRRTNSSAFSFNTCGGGGGGGGALEYKKGGDARREF